MKEFLVILFVFYAVMSAGNGNLADECRKVEAWIGKNYPAGSVSFRLQSNRLQHIRTSQSSEQQKIEQLQEIFPKAFNSHWKQELKIARQQGITFSADNKTLLKCPKNITEVVVPGCVTTIAARAFERCSRLKRITLPSGLTEIGYDAFEWCTELESITIPDSVKSIGSMAFAQCSGLKEIVVPHGVTAIEKGTFDECKNLQGIAIPDSVQNIGWVAFTGCGNLKKVTISKDCTVANNAFPKECEVTRR